MHLKLILSIFAFLMCQQFSQAAGIGLNCRTLFLDLNYNPGPAYRLAGGVKHSPPPYLRITGERINSVGVRGYELRKESGELWYSAAEVLPAAAQNDPRNFLKIFGPNVGKFFGFEMIDDNTMIVPTPDALRERITLWNKSVAISEDDKISINFYLEFEETSDRNYVTSFLKDETLPIFATGITYLHDIAVHVPILFFQKITQAIREDFQFIPDFEMFTRNEKKDKDQDFEMKFASLLRRATRSIDGMSGNLIDNVRKRASPKGLPTGHLIVSCVSAIGSRI